MRCRCLWYRAAAATGATPREPIWPPVNRPCELETPPEPSRRSKAKKGALTEFARRGQIPVLKGNASHVMYHENAPSAGAISAIHHARNFCRASGVLLHTTAWQGGVAPVASP